MYNFGFKAQFLIQTQLQHKKLHLLHGRKELANSYKYKNFQKVLLTITRLRIKLSVNLYQQ